MIVYRISKNKFCNDLSGEGARLCGGRWNHPGTACVYSSGTRALAILEYTVNTNVDDIPRALSIAAIEIPDPLIRTLSIADLPGDWREAPAPASTKSFGTALLSQSGAAVIRIPSSVIPQEFNYLLNPRHPDARLFRVVQIEDLAYDLRIKLS